MKDFNSIFRLKSIKAAKVSEISESTANSPVPPEERVNFHIGNPVQDERLFQYYLNLVHGKVIENNNQPDHFFNNLYDDENYKLSIDFFNNLIHKSAPYTPRGGFNKNKPNELITLFIDWLTKGQQESLPYDLGDKTGKREIILSSGGIEESLRVFLHAISEYLIADEINFFIYKKKLPEHLKKYAKLNFYDISNNGLSFTDLLEQYLIKNSDKPNFLLMGEILPEETRRRLRELSLTYPLFFIEVNNAFNNQSLAREAKMINRVIRFLTPEIFSNKYSLLSTIFIIGNANFLNIIETVHFQLKGTPSASEIELLTFLLKNMNFKNENNYTYPQFNEVVEEFNQVRFLHKSLEGFQKNVESIVLKTNDIISSLVDKKFHLIDNIQNLSVYTKYNYQDFFVLHNASQVFSLFLENINSVDFYNNLINSFLFSFIQTHKVYDPLSSVVVSGSSRTALGILGFHCGIKQVITTDLSWTYEHCFPNVITIPLTDDYEIDIEAIKFEIEKNYSPEWRKQSAVVINNPNNATGRIFNEEKIKELVKWCVNRKIFLIDDLSYQNVTPDINIKEIKTLAQIANELISEGYITKDDKRYIITVHALSKTDALAGARLSVVEICDKELLSNFKKINESIKPNIAAILLTYLFYRNDYNDIFNYWVLRNYIFSERMEAILKAKEYLPQERNPYNIDILPAKGSMYPLLKIGILPSGLSLDWISSGLARQGIGMVPLTTFARTQKGYELARTTFRLTLGGTDNAEILYKKTRRVLIDLNRMIEEESLNYNKKKLKVKKEAKVEHHFLSEYELRWKDFENKLFDQFKLDYFFSKKENSETKLIESEFKDYVSTRLSIFKNKLFDRAFVLEENLNFIRDKNSKIKDIFEYEFYKDNLSRRESAFRSRLYDRTVHPTQMYSLNFEIEINKVIDDILSKKIITDFTVKKVFKEISDEFLGLNVAINSSDESSELLLDLEVLLNAESYINLLTDSSFEIFLSFWGDWDGSNRPSGQGHRLVATVLIENVERMASLVKKLQHIDSRFVIKPELKAEIHNLKEKSINFVKILNDITSLTHQLETRFKGVLPYYVKLGRFKQWAIKYHLARNPLKTEWEHNDRLEQKMIDLRRKRRQMFEEYFSLNKNLRKTLYNSIPTIYDNLYINEIALESIKFKDLLKRVIITPRIHQKLITNQDQFAIDTTVHNINEINEISGKYGNPGMILALQISMSTQPDALILLDRKMRAKREEVLRTDTKTELPNVWLIPLFEDKETVKNIKSYLDKIWDYAFQSRKLQQSTADRFSTIINEVFIAGSDLSQFIGQPSSMLMYKKAKYDIINWATEKSLLGKIRVKLGSGEPMQRQGGYYAPQSGQPVFINSNNYRLQKLKESTRKSTVYASTPLMGVFAGGDLRTMQSNISEKMRFLSLKELSELLYHIKESQSFYEMELLRAGEPLTDTRLQFKTKGLQEIERLTLGKRDSVFEEFCNIFTDNFCHILYGKEEDVIGLHIISYFIARSTPPLRDRPTIRPDKGNIGNRGQKILERISEMIPLSKYGSLLRAIAHNQAQTMILGINQLTTGLFRSLDIFTQKSHSEGDNITLISERILPHLPVYETLHTLRIFQDIDLLYVGKMERAYPPGNSAFHALREDIDVMLDYIPLFQQELLRRHGLNVSEFFENGKFISDLLPTLRPDIAVLLQYDLFNTDLDKLLSNISGKIDSEWINEVSQLLEIPKRIKFWRDKIWQLLENPVYQRVNSFCELALALNSISLKNKQKDLNFNNKFQMGLGKYIVTDDTMHQFLTAAVEYLKAYSETMELPVNIIKALNENRIIKIEEPPLTLEEQKKLRFYVLQIARLAGENG